MERYVLGFAFSKDMKNILLIEKNRPHWQKGQLNGIGGKIEPEEFPIEAMVRETLEETGLRLLWHEQGLIKNKKNSEVEFECVVFFAKSDDIFRFKQKEDEIICIYALPLLNANTVHNTKFLVEIALSNDDVKFTLEY